MTGSTSVRTLLGLLAVAVLLVLTGCSSEGSPGGGGGQAPAPQAWAGRMCDSLAPAVGAPPAPTVEAADPQGSRDRLVGYLGERQRVLLGASDALYSLGPAPSPDGEAGAGRAAAVLRDRASALDERRETLVAATGPDLPATLAATGNVLALVNDGPAVVSTLALPPDLTAAARAAPSCGPLGL